MAMRWPAVEGQPRPAGTQTEIALEDYIKDAVSELFSRCSERMDCLAVSIFNLGERLDHVSSLCSDMVDRHHPSDGEQGFQGPSLEPRPAQAD